MRVYNTLGKRKEEFSPQTPGRVGIYACGVTVYDDCHIGHARSAVVFDVIVRYLRYRGLQVTWVRNFTDVDDKIINRARQENTTCQAIAEKYINAFQTDMAALGVARADIEPRATEHIKEIIDLIAALEAKGFAYQRGGDVYFPVARFPGYGKLSGRSLEDMQAGARVEVDVQKDNPLDFVLWKASKPGEPVWDSPWGPGRPGWHIECSAMCMRYLGTTIDIHGGGQDLIFPHHENEIAQSEAATGQPFVRYWLHNGLVTINQEKMSKSLGNFFTVREVLARFHPEVVRFFLIHSHYRSPLDFSDAALAEAETALLRLYTPLARIKELSGNPELAPAAAPDSACSALSVEEQERLLSLPARFEAAMDDDFNTAQALGHLFEAARLLNRVLEHSPTDSAILDLVRRLGEIMITLGHPLNLLQAEPSEMVRHLRQKTEDLKISPEEIDRLIEARRQARHQKDWARADAIRSQLTESGILLEDTPQGTVWRVKSS
ncbi:MAG: cysteine--tRNA ligase [Desulfobacca sp. 4484_104]|nr:MAG: cysteine--tRNA ligase [Desulfobacca sp. 4484_104]RLA91096.1 MAG: cysteine--tRNA ligase [Deltaproteobacteria bacterium]